MQEHIGKEIKILSNLIRRRTSNEVAPIFKSFQHGRILGFLSHNAGKDVFQKDIEKEFGVRRSTVTSTLNKMEADGLIVREGVDYDLRLKKIVLTDKAKSIDGSIKNRIDEIESEINAILTVEEREELLRIIKKLQSALE